MKLEKKKLQCFQVTERTSQMENRYGCSFTYITVQLYIHNSKTILVKLPKSQVGPVNPGGHIHRQEPSLLTQVPPCLQGKYMHSSLSVKHNNTNHQHLTHSHLSGKVFSTNKVLFVANLPTSIKLLVHVPILTQFIKSLQFW